MRPGAPAGHRRCRLSGRRWRRAMTEPDLRTPPGPAGSLTAGKRAGPAAGPRAAYQAVLRAFAATGRPPEPPELEETAPRHGLNAGQALPMVATLGRDNEHIVASSHQMQLAAEGRSVQPLALTMILGLLG